MSAKTARQERRARVEAMRREQQRRERRRTILMIGGGSILAVAILAAAIIPSVVSAHNRSQQRSVGYVTKPTAAAAAAGCTGVRNDKQIGRDHVTNTVDYAKLTAQTGESIPPSSGPHNPDPLPDFPNFYSRAQQPPVERAVHDLEHGFVVAWYDSQLPDSEVSKLQNAPTGSRVLVVPWNRGNFPDGKHFVLTAWDRTQRCATVNIDVIKAFQAKYGDPQTGQDWKSPTAPETGAAGGTPIQSTPPSVAPSAPVKQ